MNDIHIDIMDYIVPATCTDAEFRQMWAEFEWENKVSVNTTISDLRDYLAHLLKSTNMRCLTPEKVFTFGNYLFENITVMIPPDYCRLFLDNADSWLQICTRNRYLVRMH